MNKFLQFFLFLAMGHLGFSQQLLNPSLVQSFTKEDINIYLFLTGIPIQASHGVSLYKVNYLTPHLNGVIDTASGVVAIPTTSGFKWPVLFYQHGTANSRDDVPSAGSFESLVAAVGAGLGYVSVAADYIGLGDSKGLHPYLHAATEASAARDLFLAAQQMFANNNVQLNKQLFITGYSQGGHAAMALHQLLAGDGAIEGFEVTAASHMSGPYSISTEMVNRLLSEEEYLFPGYPVYTLLSYDAAYQLFDSIGEFLREPYVGPAQLFADGLLSITELHDSLNILLKQQHGKSIVKFLFQDTIFAQLNNPESPLSLALKENDTYAWVPQSPTRLVYCKADDQVVYTNALFADSVMSALGALDVEAVDVNSQADHGECVLFALGYTIPFFNQFVEVTTGVKEIAILHGVKMYPNPAHEQIWLDGLPEKSTITLFNLQGQRLKVWSSHSSFHNLVLPQVASGHYILRVEAMQGIQQFKLQIH